AGPNRERTALWLERQGRYGPLIRGRLRERGMPEDLLYLALIESGLSPRAYSRAHAAGIWQFIAETGRRYGLEITSYVDERRDPVASTEAALDYLAELYERFGSWYLAAAAYNTGENRVERILRERAGGRRGDDELYWEIARYLPKETRDYVPLMLAAGHIAKEPEKYGFRELSYQEPLRYEVVRVPGGTSFEEVAEAAGVEHEEIRDLNPHLIRGMTPPGRTFAVRIPARHGETFAANFERVRAESRVARASIVEVPGARRHTVRRGETLSHIARRYGTTVAELRQANGGIQPTRLRAGQRIVIPVGSSGGASVAARYHRVARGETLWGIARRYGVTVQQLQRWNGMGRRTRILPGQRLRVSA
ncbi:MAG TPA: LysM peptidoglycan-binding domain-containing protein, partial [Longimicrobiales bacterium]|nr:LysM peptidoglycan-binding domain-containing protein [Longimicrobiales bacterium]